MDQILQGSKGDSEQSFLLPSRLLEVYHILRLPGVYIQSNGAGSGRLCRLGIKILEARYRKRDIFDRSESIEVIIFSLNSLTIYPLRSSLLLGPLLWFF